MAYKTVKFYNGNEYPALGLGTWRSSPNEVTRAVEDAIDIGYRHIDCAAVYENEKEIGIALAKKMKEGVIQRGDIYITSKLWNTCHRPELVEPALKKTLSDLGLQYLDLYLIHWPFAFKEGDALLPEDSNGKLLAEDVDYLDTWQAMEALLEKGLVKNIGVSNFNSAQLQRLLAHCKVKPVTNQVECHPYFNQTKLSEFCKSKEITITAFSPFAAPGRPNAENEPRVLEDPKIKELAKKYNKTPSQITLRYQIQRGHLVIPKSVTKSRIAENFNIFDFEITAADMKEIGDLDRNWRVSTFARAVELKHYPFHAEY